MSLSSKLVPSSGCLFGAYAGNSGGCDAASGLAVRLRNFETLIGRTAAGGDPLNIVNNYRDWNDYATTFPSADEQALVDEGRLLLIHWTPRIFGTTTQYQWADIAAGTYDDSILIPQARHMRDWGQLFFLAFHNEMNAASTAQNGEQSGTAYGTDAQYASAAQHVHDVFLAQGATNVIWVFKPSGFSTTISRMATLYPGDAYVDWIGFDPYGTSISDDLAHVLDVDYPMYTWATSTKAGSHTMPIMMAEWGKKETGGSPSKGAFFDEVRTNLQSSYPQIKAIVYFNSISGVSECLNSTPDAVSHFATLAAASYFNPDVSSSPPPVAQGSFRASASKGFSGSSAQTITVPSTVQAGDGMLLWHGSTRTGLKSAAEGTNATNVTVGNSGSSGSNPADAVTTTPAPQYDTSQKHAGSSSMHASLTAQTSCSFNWVASFPWPTTQNTTYWGRLYYRYSANPGAISRIFQQHSAANAAQWGIGIDTNGKLIVRDLAAGATRATSTATPATNTWHRLEWQAFWDGSLTTVTVRLYLDAIASETTLDETMTSTAFAQAAAPGQGKFGLLTSASATYDVYVDDFGLAADTWMGPSGTPPVLTGPSGWLEVVPTGTQSIAAGAAALATKCYRRTAVAGDPNSSVALNTDVLAHGAIGLVAYSGVDQFALVDVAAASTKSSDSTTVVTPNATTTANNELIISAGFVRDNPGGLTTSWSLPGGEAQRAAAFGSSPSDGKVALVITDDATAHAIGTYGTKTLTATATSFLGVGWTVAVKATTATSSGQGLGMMSQHN